MHYLQRLPAFLPVSAGSPAALQLPLGPTYHQIILRYKRAGVDATESQCKSDLTEIRIKANGRTLFQVSAKHVIDLLNKYYGVGLTTLQGATYDVADNATNNVVTSGANVNGVILRIFGVAANGSGNARVEIGGNIILMSYAQSNTSDSKVEKDLFVPPGLSVSLVSTVVGNKAWCYYEVL